MAIRNEILTMASNLTSGDRDREYGDPMVNLACATDLKKVFKHYQSMSGRIVSDAEKEAIDMVLTKLSRLACGPAAKADTYIDGACYFAIAGEAFLKEQQGHTPTYGFSYIGALQAGGSIAPGTPQAGLDALNISGNPTQQVSPEQAEKLGKAFGAAFSPNYGFVAEHKR